MILWDFLPHISKELSASKPVPLELSAMYSLGVVLLEEKPSREPAPTTRCVSKAILAHPAPFLPPDDAAAEVTPRDSLLCSAQLTQEQIKSLF